MPLSVIGAGFGRTGTMSLKLALEQLGFGPCYHMEEVFKNPKAPGYWEAVADGEPVDWEEVFAGYHATVDWPGATFYRELAEAYPQAKVILTLRDPEAWFASTQSTIFNSADPEIQQIVADAAMGRMGDKVVFSLFDHQIRDKERVISVFNRHNETVRNTIPPERLLVYEVSQGWEPLCAFLGVPVPAGPMPKLNSTENFAENLAGMVANQKAARAEG
jgi:hypothetical protein